MRHLPWEIRHLPRDMRHLPYRCGISLGVCGIFRRDAASPTRYAVTDIFVVQKNWIWSWYALWYISHLPRHLSHPRYLGYVALLEKDDPVLQDNVGNSTVEDYMIKKMIIVIITLWFNEQYKNLFNFCWQIFIIFSANYLLKSTVFRLPKM
jgi:hypothetical protein